VIEEICSSADDPNGQLKILLAQPWGEDGLLKHNPFTDVAEAAQWDL
jgi:hypothetical protein